MSDWRGIIKLHACNLYEEISNILSQMKTSTYVNFLDFGIIMILLDGSHS